MSSNYKSCQEMATEGPRTSGCMHMETDVETETGLTREFLGKIHFALAAAANLFLPVGLVLQNM